MTNANPKTLERLTKARATLIIEQPFYGQLALRLRLVENNDIETLAVDGTNIFYNAKFCDGLPVPQLRSALAHEVGHCVFQHIARRGARSPKKWNYAGDFVINEMLEGAGFEPIPGYWCRDAKFNGMTADQVYNLLPDDPDDAGAGAGGKALCEIVDGAPGECADAAARTAIENEWKVATMQAATTAKRAGKLPKSLERFVDQLFEAKVDWRDRLRRMFTERSKNDYSWSRPNRRLAGQGIFLPGLYSENIGTVVVVTDDSGSIGNETLAAFSAEIVAIRTATLPVRTIHMSCDAAVNHYREFLPEDEFVIVSKGGGGTDFRPPFARLDADNVTPAVFVYLTDGYGPFPSTPPNYPVLWCMTTDVVAPFGETVRIEL